MPKLKLGTVLLVGVIVFGFLALVPLESFAKVSFLMIINDGGSGGGSATVSFHGAQRWLFFDKAGRLVDQRDSYQKNLLFDFLGRADQLSGADKGYIQVYEWFTVDQAVPGHIPTGLGDYAKYDVVVFTRKLTVTVSVDGRSFATSSFVPWNLGSSEVGFIADAYARILQDGSSVSFITGDPAGTTRGAVIYLLLRHDLRPADCVTYPSACVDLSSFVDKGQDFTIGFSVTEVWNDYETTFDPLFQQNCDSRLLLTQSWCVHRLGSSQTVTDQYSAKLTDFGYFTTLSGQTSFVQTQSSTALTTVVIHLSSTVIDGKTVIVAVETHQTTTITNSETLTGPPNYGSDVCTWLPFLCEDLFGIPTWAILTAVALVLILVFARKPSPSAS